MGLEISTFVGHLLAVMSGVVTDTEMNVKELRQLITDSRRKLEELKVSCAGFTSQF